jgi:hypothetical protein
MWENLKGNSTECDNTKQKQPFACLFWQASYKCVKSWNESDLTQNTM